nr:DUF4377 domain-containing protein [Acinetobacter sp. Marseille-Q1620]
MKYFIFSLLIPLTGLICTQTQASPSNNYKTVYFEIAPHTKKCTGEGTFNCLQVKELKYNHGKKVYLDKNWKSFYGNIQGFTHNPKQINIVKLKEYKVHNPPADASSLRYELDKIIEQKSIQ